MIPSLIHTAFVRIVLGIGIVPKPSRLLCPK
jgi:hypothetical protein